jgi:hypothetical protein
MNTSKSRTTISIKSTTKTRLNQWKANGQCYDGFLSQLLQMWEKKKAIEKSRGII